MPDFSNAELTHLAIHQVGNKSNDEGIIASEVEIAINGEIAGLLTSYFTKPFKTQEFYNFSHESDLKLNEVYTYVKSIFHNPNSLHLQSINLAKHLYEQSNHPQIKPGELYVVYFENCYEEDELLEVIGIFKSEQKQTFLKVFPEGNTFNVSKDDGININKLDKGCLIINDRQVEGYKVMLVDNTNKDDALYWKDRFLNVKPQEDTFYQTKNYIQLCKDFATEAFADADTVDTMGLVEESEKFFKQEDLFDKAQFEERVLQEPEIIDAFENFKGEFAEKNELNLTDEFDINSEAVKKMKRVFKSVIKLDKNFHIYVHGNRSYIRKGYDEESRLNFYQIFYNQET